MRFFHRLIAAFIPESRRESVTHNNHVRQVAATVKENSEQAISEIEMTTGIWHQDMLQGSYQRQRQEEDARYG